MDKMKLTFVNVGYGEAILLECPDPRFPGGVFVMLIDGGSGEAGEYADRATGRTPLADYLADQALDHIDLMVSTHIHEDHICGMLPVAGRFPPAGLWQLLPPAFCRDVMRRLDAGLAQTPSQDKFIRALNDCQTLVELVEAEGGQVRAMKAGDSGRLCGGLTFQVLAPGTKAREELRRLCRETFAETDQTEFRRSLSVLDARMNNFSLMLLLDYQGTRILLPGDTNCHGYGGIDPAALEAHLFKVGHHGQRDGADRALLEAVRPRAVVCCASSDRRYDSAHPDTLRLMEEYGAKLYFSDCPRLPGRDLPPHRALAFSVGEHGSFEAQYIP